jgi:photosystem II stability/assembly factor-like uncharacterized protein
MKHYRIILLFAAMLFASSARARDEARTKVEWLRALATQARLAYQFDPTPDPELFREATADGRTQIEFIADSLGADAATPGQWILLDEAATICLTEAGRMKALAAANPGTPKETACNNARWRFLMGAARILGHARAAATASFDAGTAGLPASGAEMTDWSLPGDLRLREIAGQARLNVNTGAFSGRLSGQLEMPNLQTTLSVPNFSFDSAGNIDLTAYGATAFPTGASDAVTLLVPPRRPLSLHLGSDGALAASGALRLGFPGGNTVDAFFDIADPKYSFGLSFEGKATIKLAKKLTVMLPTIDAATVYQPDAIDGLAQFFGSFGAGMETFLAQSPDLPSPGELEIGTPPDFNAPRFSVPFDVLDAWLVALSNDHVRPAINGTLSDALAEVTEMLAGLKGSIAAAADEIQPTLNDLQQLERMAEANRRIAAIVKEGIAQGALGNTTESQALLTEAATAAEQARDIAKSYLENLPPDAEMKRGVAAIRLVIKADTTVEALGGQAVLGDETFTNLLNSKLDQWSASTLARYGFAPDGSILDPDTVEALQPDDFQMLLHFTIHIGGLKSALGAESTLPSPLMTKLVRTQFSKTRTLYQNAVAAGDEESRTRQSLNLIRVAGNFQLFGIDEGSGNPAGLATDTTKDTLNDFRARYGDTDGSVRFTRYLRTARAAMDRSTRSAARRSRQLLGETEDSRPILDQNPQFSSGETPFFERWYRTILAIPAANRDPANPDAPKSVLASVIRSFVKFQTERFDDKTMVRQNLEEVFDTLVAIADAVAIAEDMLPDDAELLGELQQNWHALHISFTAVAEARRMHWMLAAYARELAAATTRYGDGLSGALAAAFESAGSEAVAGLSRIAAYLGGIVAGLDTRAYAFALPGDIEIRRLRGTLVFDRSSGDWSFGFGGRLAFPDIHGIFEVTSATLASDGAFSLAMLASSNTAFGLNDDFSLSLSVPAFTGSLFPSPSLASFTGHGTLARHPGTGVPESYQVDVAYAPLDPGHRFEVRSAFSGNRELFSPEVMVFSGGFGFDLETDLSGAPTQGGAEIQTSLGLLLRPESAAKAPEIRTSSDYYLTFTGDARIDFPAGGRKVLLTLNSGTLSLPPDIFSAPGGGAPTITLATPVCAKIDLDNPALLSWCDTGGHPARIAFDHIGFTIPGVPDSAATDVSSAPDVPDPATIPGFQAGVSAVLLLSGNQFPVIEKIAATLAFPMPGTTPADPHRAATLDIAGTDWRIDGLPGSASVTLRNDLRVADIGGFRLDFLAGSGFMLEKITVGGEKRVKFTATGNVHGTIDKKILADADTGDNFAFGGGAGGVFSWDFVDPPTLTLDTVMFSGAMKLGGAEGLALAGVDANGIPAPAGVASIELLGLDHLFTPDTAHPFEIKLNASFNAAQTLWFGLKDARLVFDGIDTPPNTEPQFNVAAIGFREDASTVKLLGLDALPARLTAGSISFQNPNLGFPDLLELPNLKFVVSGVVDIHLGEGESDKLPRLYGEFQDVRLRFPDGAPPEFGVDSLALSLENLTIGDMAGLTGGLAVGNLDDPDNLFFAGMVGGSFNGVGIKAIVATRLDGLIGLCLSANGGPAGIPLDGGMLGGILLTGATGGVYFGNSFANPCEFKGILGLDPATGNPTTTPQAARAPANPAPDITDLHVLAWEKLAEYNNQCEVLKNWRPAPKPRAARDGDPDCPTGPCPANSVGLLAQRHPSTGEEPSAENYQGKYAGKVIYKFTSLDKRTVDELLESAGIDIEGLSTQEVGAQFAAAVRAQINDLLAAIPHPPEFDATIDDALDIIEPGLAGAVTQGLDAAAGSGQTPLEALYEAAYAGVPSQDVTILLDGTLTWAPVAAALSLTGGATASTTGSAGIYGSLNLVGIPVGTGEFYYSLTDSNGDPNPSFCGGARAALGPLKLGHMKMAYQCDGCVTGVVAALGDFIANMTSALATQADPILRQFVADALGVEAAQVAGPLPGYFGPSGSLTQQEQIAVLAQLLNLPQLVAFLDTHPAATAQFGHDALAALGTASVDLLLDIYAAINPEFTFCGEVEPKLFGFSLTGGNSLVAANLHATKTEIQGGVAFSPSYVFGNLPFSLMSGGAMHIVPALDQATMGVAMTAPAITRDSFVAMKTDPGAYALDQLETILTDAQLTFGYELKPFGMKLADGEGRVILPSIQHHPDNPDAYPPGTPFSPPFDPAPDREELLGAALAANLLADATWRGKGDDLANLFPGNPDAAGKELARDYFPRGGFIGAAHLELPKAIAEFPPLAEIDTLVAADSSADARIAAAQDIGSDYLLGTEPAGDMTMYVPFPSPPAAFWTGTRNPREFVEQLSTLDFDALLGNPGAGFTNDFFMKGHMSLKLLGVEFNESELVADAAAGVFRFSSSVPETSWLHKFVQADVDVEIRPASYLADNNPESLQPEARIQAALDAVTGAATDAEKHAAAQQLSERIADSLPRASFSATLGADLNAAFADAGLADFVRFNSGAGFFAFSPCYEPDYAAPGYTGDVPYPDPDPAVPGPYTRARRNGGFVAVGDFSFGYALAGANPLVIDIPDMQIAITGGTQNPLPNLAARAVVSNVQLPDLPSFSDAILVFDSNPPTADAPIFSMEGTLGTFDVGSAVTIQGLGGGDLRGALEITRNAASLEIDPAEAVLPSLGNVAVAVFGETQSSPFSFSSAPGETWSANIRVAKPASPDQAPTFELRDPLNPAGPVVASFTTTAPVSGTIGGTGMDSFSLSLEIPKGFDISFFPGQPTASTAHVGGAGTVTLYLDSQGRFYVDFGASSIDLPGALAASGRLELGFNPGGDGANVAVTPGTSLNFGTVALGDTAVRQITVQNSGNAPASVNLGASTAEDFSVSTDGFTLPPGASTAVDVVFHPSRAGSRPGILTLRTNDPARPSISRDLSGAGAAVPRYFQSRDSIHFPPTVVGGASKASVTIANTGTAPMIVTSVQSSNPSVFPVSPAGGFTLAPGEQRLLTISFQPGSETSLSASFSIQGAAPVGSRSIPLNGNGTPPQWATVLDSSMTGSTAALNDVKLLDNGTGWAVGNDGAFYETRDFGQSWTPRCVSQNSLSKISVHRAITRNIIAEYHFEEPAGAMLWRDDGPSGHHATTPSSGNRPLGGMAHGILGAGLKFQGGSNNSNTDYLNLGTFDLPHNWAISMWINPSSTANGQCFLAKNTSSGGYQIVFGFYWGGYHLRFNGTQASTPAGAPPKTGWQHLVLNAHYDSANDQTRIDLYRDGAKIWNNTLVFNGPIAPFGGGRPWALGQKWFNSTASDPFRGEIDEVCFFGRTLGTSEITALANGESGQTILVAGAAGTILRSATRGRSWQRIDDPSFSYVPDNFYTLPYWRNWSQAVMTGDGHILAAGVKRYLKSNVNPDTPSLMLEDHYLGNRFGVIQLMNGENGERLTALTPRLGLGISGEVYYAATSSGRIFSSANGLTGTWPQHGSLNLSGSLHDIDGYSANNYGTVPDYIAVGDGGAIIQSSNNGDPALVNHDLTTETLRSISHTRFGLFPPNFTFHVVGDNGIYLRGTSSGSGTPTWTLVSNGLTGNNRGVDAIAASPSRVVVVGEENRIQKWQSGGGGMLAFYPGELDFGSLPPGGSRTLPLHLRNGGAAPVQVSSIAVSGSAFSLAQSAIDTLAPGESATLQVRYKPAAVSAFDYGEVRFTVGGDTMRASLLGHCENSEWKPVPIHLPASNIAMDGEVLDLAIAGSGADATLYALMDSPTGSKVLKLDGAAPDGKWAQMALPNPGKTRGYQIKSLDAIRDSGSDIVAISGTLLEGGTAIGGALLVTGNGGASWQNKKPAASDSSEFQDVRLTATASGTQIEVASKESSDEFTRKWTADLATTKWTSSAMTPQIGKSMLGAKNYQSLHFTGDDSEDFVGAGSSLLSTKDSGLSWSPAYKAGPAASLKAAVTTGSLVWTGGSIKGKAVAWVRQTAAATARPVLSASDIEFFQELAPGGSTAKSITLQNIGSAPLPVHNLRIESGDPLCRFHISGAVPTSIPAGGSVALPVVFDALPDPAEAAPLDPAAYFRFEDAWGATSFLDHGPDHLPMTSPPAASSRPAIAADSADAASPRRGRHLEFDGDDYAEMNGIDSLGAAYSFSAWVRIDSSGNHAFFGKHNSDGSRNLILAGYYYGGYYFAVNHQGYQDNTPVMLGWQHIAVVCRESGGNTAVSFYRNGTLLWTHTYTTRITSLAGRPWVLGMDWDGDRKTDFLRGAIDDFAIFRRALSPPEIQTLATSSPVCGEHRAAIVVNSGAEDGRRTIALRATVREASDLVVIDTVPSGQSITVDGIARTTPFAAAIRCTASNPTEWPLGSLHRISAPAPFTVTDANGNELRYQFGSWNAGSGPDIVVAARPGMPDILGTCRVAEIIPASPPPASAPQKQSDPAFNIAEAMAGTPHGPFIRISNGSLSINGFGDQTFAIQGELLAGFSKIHARLATSSLSIPETSGPGTSLFEFGPASWVLDLAGSSLRLAADLPSVKIMGGEGVPGGAFSIELQTGADTDFAATFSMNSDLLLAPSFIEFKKGDVAASFHNSAWSFSFAGGMRILRLPDELSSPLDGVTDSASWAIDTSTAFSLSGDISNFSITLSQLLGASAPMTFVDSAPWFMAGDFSLTRTAGGPVSLEADISSLNFAGHAVPITPLAGSVSTGGELRLTGTAGSGTILDFGGAKGVRLEKSGASSACALVVSSHPVPRLRLDLPALVLKSNNSDFPAAGIAIPAISLDTSGAFDTGCLPLPAFTFAGIAISRPSGGQPANNYVRLRRDSSGNLTFDTRAEIRFLPACDPEQFSLTLAPDTLRASYRSHFCVLPDPVSFSYDANATCPFSGSAFGFDIHFGPPSCTCVSAGGIKILGSGTCP